MLYLISIGIFDKKDMSIKALNTARKCDILYLDSYTHKFKDSSKELSIFIDKKVIELTRGDIEDNSDKILKKAKTKNVGILVGGDCLSATTHQSLILDAKQKDIKVEVIHGSSIFTAVAETGLFIYNFGKIASIPFENKNIKIPIEILENNLKINAHTLFLLDLDPEKNKFLSVKEGIEYLEKNNVKGKILACARLGSKDFMIKYGDIEKIKKINFGNGPCCLIIPSKKLHFVEEESLKKWEL